MRAWACSGVKGFEDAFAIGGANSAQIKSIPVHLAKVRLKEFIFVLLGF
jgi:hypothetical protein